MTDDKLTGAAMRFDKVTYEQACALKTSAPLELTEAHFDQLAIISKKSESNAREAVRQAQLAIVHAAAEKSTPPLHTKAAPAVPPVSPSRMVAYYESTTDDETMAEYCARAPISATPLVCFGKLLAFTMEMNARNVERNTRLDTLEQRIKEQDARILELEASAAARS